MSRLKVKIDGKKFRLRKERRSSRPVRI